jgi:hypothetical protein
MRALTVVAATLLATLFSIRVDADCDEPSIESTVPLQYEAPLATVPPNATLLARYSASAVYEGEPVVLKPEGMPPLMLTGTFDAVEGLLKAVPPEGLTPGLVYRVTWPGLRGMTGPRGKNTVVDFNASATPDTSPPVFSGVSALDWDWTRKTDACTDELLDRYTFLLTPGGVTDDGGVDALSVLIFQTSGPGIAAPRLVHIAAMPRKGATLRVPLGSAQGVGTLCFSALVRDSQMRTSNANTQPMCVTTTEAPYFVGCAFAPRSSRSMGLLWTVLGLIGLSRVRRRWV